MDNILTSGISFKGRDVYIVGSGPNGKDYFEHLPPDGVVIAINKAICAMLRHCYWLCVTPALLREGYFHFVMHEFINDGPHIPILAKGPLTDAYPEAPYTFAQGRPFDIGSMGVEQGKLRTGAGTVGVALQLAQQLDAERCILVGVDMHGKDYFDGTRNENKGSIGPDGTWSQIAMLQQLINCLRAIGMDVVSLSKTKLKVEVI